MRLSAMSCLARGLASLRANWELVFASWLQMVATAALTAAGLLPLLLLFGADLRELVALEGAQWGGVVAERGAEWVAAVLDDPARLAVALGAALAIWLAALLVYCFFQGGLFGTLVAGDRQAPPGRPRDWRWFRTYRLRNFVGWGRRYLWRYFWLVNIFFTLYLLSVLVLLLLVMLAVWGGERWGAPAAVGIGCGGALPLVFLALVLFLWSKLATADAAREESGVWTAVTATLPILGRRLGASLLFLALLVFAGLAAGVVFLPVSIGLDLVLAGQEAARLGGQVVLSVLQWLWNGVVAVAYGASLVGLVRSELAHAEAAA